MAGKREYSELQDDKSGRSQKASLWSESLETMVIFGDSYSAPTEEETWVNYLQGDARFHHTAIRNFAFPGATAEEDLVSQLARFFAVFPPMKTRDSKPVLDPTRTCYVLALGVNDCGRTDEDDLDAIVENVLDAAHRLYIKAGARNFVFIDVPPIDRSPAGLEHADTIQGRVSAWNAQLNAQVSEFARDMPRVTVFCFSVHAVLTEVLDNPEEYEYAEEDTTEEGGAIWADELHVTAAVHKTRNTSPELLAPRTYVPSRSPPQSQWQLLSLQPKTDWFGEVLREVLWETHDKRKQCALPIVHAAFLHVDEPLGGWSTNLFSRPSENEPIMLILQCAHVVTS
ncbi:hypothetical protein FISHEDRAFT_73495 [Fistulina hepatica ATCC 64428]|uniref:Uncharacterized protein n=1 Tax=Fistulina hepatica ATCC 64428 TaxID=1128425 RepID=A0A0D7ACY4_9AGAR|nr:hypothetical protein FISHEDRAFT_73495 [Fistulina hepatica ATCC 64428]